jgi:membrane-associated protease RseP (regulator of RpoE activity)
MTWLLGAVVFLLGLLLSIALHEVGHYAPARRFNVKVTQWMVGIGPTAWSTRRGETEFGIKWLPFGGYIRMVGMLPPAPGTPPGKVRRWSTGPLRSLIESAREAAWEDVGPRDHGRLFYQRPWWQRVIIMTGGPAMNILLGFAFLSIALTGIGVSTAQPTVQAVVAVSPAVTAGLQPGDRIIAYGDRPVRSWNDLTGMIRADAGQPVTLTIVRGGVTEKVPLTIGVNGQGGFLGIEPAYAREHMTPVEVAGVVGAAGKEVTAGLVHLPERMVGVWQAAFSDAPRAVDGPIGVVGATRLGGDVAASDLPLADRLLFLLELLGSFNIAIGVFNLIPLLPLDGGHIVGALWEGIKRGFAKLAGRPDPGYVDVAKLLPIAYVAASFLVAMGALLVVADIVNPIKLFNG